MWAGVILLGVLHLPGQVDPADVGVPSAEPTELETLAEPSEGTEAAAEAPDASHDSAGEPPSAPPDPSATESAPPSPSPVPVPPDAESPLPPTDLPSTPDAPSASGSSFTDGQTLALRVVGAFCGGVMGCYVGQLVAPLIIVPLVGAAVVGAVLFAPALASVLGLELILASVACGYFGIPLFVLLIPATFGAVLGGFGWAYAPDLIENVRDVVQPASSGAQQVMAY